MGRTGPLNQGGNRDLMAQRAAQNERARLAQLEASRRQTGRNARPDDATVIERDTLLRHGVVPGQSRESVEALIAEHDKDGIAGLNEAEFDAFYAAAYGQAADAANQRAGSVNTQEIVQPDAAFRVIEGEARDVNFEALNPDSPETARIQDEARGQIEANRPLEEAALGTLTPEQRQRYDEVARLTENDPRARLDLQRLLVEGKLTHGVAANDGSDLLTTLHRAGTQQLAPGIEAGPFVSDMVQEVANPAAINQQARPTCTATAVQIQLATENPAEYVRITGGLASAHGEVQLANGQTVAREAGTNNADDSRRTSSSRLFQSTMMEIGTKGDYQNSADADGLSATGVDRMMDALSGGNVTTYEVKSGARGFLHHLTPDKEVSDDELMGIIEDAVARGEMVNVGMKFDQRDGDSVVHGQHQVVVTEIKDGMVHYTNPWGKQEITSVDMFRENLVYASVGNVAPTTMSDAEVASKPFGERVKILQKLNDEKPKNHQAIANVAESLLADAAAGRAPENTNWRKLADEMTDEAIWEVAGRLGTEGLQALPRPALEALNRELKDGKHAGSTESGHARNMIEGAMARQEGQ